MQLPTSQVPERLAYSLGEVAHSLGISERSVYNRLYDGSLRAIQVGGRRLVLKADLERFLASCPALTKAEAA